MNSLVAYDSSDDEVMPSIPRTESSLSTTNNRDSDSDSDFEDDDTPSTINTHGKFSRTMMASFDAAPYDSDEEEEEDTELSKPAILGGVFTKPTPVLGEAGLFQRTFVSDHEFKRNYNRFQSQGIADDPSISNITTHLTSGPIQPGAIFTPVTAHAPQTVKHTITAKNPIGRKRVNANYDPSSSSYTGSWALLEGELESRQEPRSAEEDERVEASKRTKAAEEGADERESSTFHGEQLYDALGRSFVAMPTGFKHPGPDLRCYVPQKRVYTWAGHSKGVSSVNFFPSSGHLLLTSSMDGSVKVWDTLGEKRCQRTYMGHTEAVRQSVFSGDGTRIVSVSYDKSVKIWDTETGKVLSRFRTGHVPVCAAVTPGTNNELLVGMSNRCINQWDVRTGEIAQEYKDHMGAVNTITFLPGQDKFVSTSDDKKFLVYEYGVPVVIKQIMEPDLHSCPSVALHPSGKYLVANAMDNQALVFACQDKLKLNRRKRFSGHLTAGFACGLDFSPDGKFLVSGDAEGRMFYWDFKTGKLLRKIKAHDQVCIGVKWHPADVSRVASCSWDGTTKYWA